MIPSSNFIIRPSGLRLVGCLGNLQSFFIFMYDHMGRLSNAFSMS